MNCLISSSIIGRSFTFGPLVKFYLLFPLYWGSFTLPGEVLPPILFYYWEKFYLWVLLVKFSSISSSVIRRSFTSLSSSVIRRSFNSGEVLPLISSIREVFPLILCEKFCLLGKFNSGEVLPLILWGSFSFRSCRRSFAFWGKFYSFGHLGFTLSSSVIGEVLPPSPLLLGKFTLVKFYLLSSLLLGEVLPPGEVFSYSLLLGEVLPPGEVLPLGPAGEVFYLLGGFTS